MHPVADIQGLMQVDGGLHGLALAPGGEIHECAHDDDQGRKTSRSMAEQFFRIGCRVQRAATVRSRGGS